MVLTMSLKVLSSIKKHQKWGEMTHHGTKNFAANLWLLPGIEQQIY